METGDPIAVFIDAACSGQLEQANAILAAHPDVAVANIFTAAIVGDEATVRRYLADDPPSATAKGGPRGWDALTHLCFSRYVRPDDARFVRTAEALLDAGADPNTGWFEGKEWESAIYGAAGIAHHPELTRLLLERGADPNDGETPYHAPEWFDNRAMEVIVESGKLNAAGLATMLIRKLDWTNYRGVKWLLEHGADPNVLQHSLFRDNPLRFIELLLDHGAVPGPEVFSFAARHGRADALDLFESRGFSATLDPSDAFLAACAHGISTDDGAVIERLKTEDPSLLARFAGAGNTAGVRILLDLGFGIASRGGRAGEPGGTALHLAVWRERYDTVKLLIERGAPLELTNKSGDTSLSLAARALVEMSEFTPHESLDILVALLDAGARPDAIRRFPTGNAEADALIEKYRR